MVHTKKIFLKNLQKKKKKDTAVLTWKRELQSG